MVFRKNKSTQGVTAIEYGLIGALISIAIIGSVTLTGVDTKKVFCSVGSALETSVGGQGSDCSGDSSNAQSNSQDSKTFSNDFQALKDAINAYDAYLQTPSPDTSVTMNNFQHVLDVNQQLTDDLQSDDNSNQSEIDEYLQYKNNVDSNFFGGGVG